MTRTASFTAWILALLLLLLLLAHGEFARAEADDSSLSGGSASMSFYEYDELNRLVRVRSDGTEVAFTYDAVGSRVAVAVPESSGIAPLALGLALVSLLSRLSLLSRRRKTRANRRKTRAKRAATGASRSVQRGLFAGCLLLAPLGSSPAGAADLPGFRMVEPPPRIGEPEASLALAEVGAADDAAASSMTAAATQASVSTEITPEIQELARALRYDVDLIYEYVYSQIRYSPVWGSHKGAMGALLDRTGNDFDQASLMIALLRASGYTASFVYGRLKLDGATIVNWLNIENSHQLLNRYLHWSGRNQEESYSKSDQGMISYAYLERIWVKVNIGGTDYVFDPALKSNTIQQGIDVETALGYSRSTLVASALAGATQTANSLKNINQSNLDNALAGYAANLEADIRANHAGATLDDIVGGTKINPLTSFPRVASFPNQVEFLQTGVSELVFADLPAAYRATLRLRLPGIDETFNTDSLAGKRLTIFYESNRPVLRLAGSVVDTGSSVTAGSSQQLQVNIVHPLDLSFANASGAISIAAGGSYLVLNGWGETGEGTVRYHEGRAREFEFDGAGSFSERRLGETLAVFANSWLAETSATWNLASKLGRVHPFRHHSVGIAGQTASPYVDIPFVTSGAVNEPDDLVEKLAVFFSAMGMSSAFEGGVFEQRETEAVSTVELFGIANDQSNTFFDVNASNFASVKSALVGYSASELASIQTYLTAGARVVLPSNGNLGADDWQGSTFLSYHSGLQTLSYIISGGLNGGYTTVPGFADAPTVPPRTPAVHAKSNDPVDLVTGDFLLDQTDLTVGSQPFPLGLAFQRSYSSGSRYSDGPLGLGWRHGFDLEATLGSDAFQGFGADSPIDAVAAIAALVVSLDLTSGTQSLEELLIATLTQRSLLKSLTDNIVTVSEPSRTSVFVRLPDGRYNPPPGSASLLTEEPDGSYLLTTENGVELDFDLDGKIEGWQDPNGNVVSFDYTGEDLASVSDAAGHTLTLAYSDDRVSSISDGARSYAYAYDAVGNLVAVTDANGEVTTFEYPGDGLLGQVFTPANPTNAQVSNSYNALGHVETQLDANGNEYVYYIAGSRSEEVDPSSRSKIAYYDDREKVVREIDALGFERTFEYDGEERLTRRTEPEGNLSEFEYDDRHNLTRVIAYPKPGASVPPIVRSFTYEPEFNRIATETDPRLNVTAYSYDPDGNLERIEHPQVGGQNPVSTLTHNGRGQVLSTTDPEGRITAFTYAPTTADLLTRTEGVGTFDLVTTMTYDAAGDPVFASDPRGNRVLFTRDDMRRVTQTQSPAPWNSLSRFTYDEDGNLERREREISGQVPWQTMLATYTPSGKLALEIDPGLQTTLTEYDALDRPSKVTDAMGRATHFLYTARGELERVLDATGVASAIYTYTANGQRASVTDARGNTTGYRYDGFDRLEFTDFPNGQFEELVYDASSNVVTKRLRSSEVVSFAYDAQDRVVSKAPSGAPTVTYAYDRSGRLTSEILAGEGATTYVYDAVGRLSSKQDPNGRVVGSQYDASGNRSRVTYPDGEFVTYEFDALNRLSTIRDAGVQEIASYSYDALSRRTSTVRANGTSTTYTFELDGDLSSVAHAFAGSTATWDYAYDAVHSRTSLSVSDPQFLYDLSQLVSTTYTSNAMNQQDSALLDVFPEPYAVGLGYDLRGNMASTLSHTYSYDAESRLTTAYLPGGDASYAYDASGLRTGKTFGGTATEYVLDGGQILAEYDGSGGLLRRYVYAGLDEPVRMTTASGATYAYHADGLGSVVALSDDTGNLVETYAYGPSGEVDAPSSVSNPFRFTGREYDAESGLYYYRARHYDPALGRFLQPDPIGYADGLNLYLYVGANPVNFVDPTGLYGRSQRGQTTVEIRYNEATGPGAHHGYVVLTSPEGDQFYSRAGPGPRIDGLGSSGGGGIFGTIHAESGAYVPGAIDYTTDPAASLTLHTTTDPAAFGKFRDALVGFEGGLNAAGIPYNPLIRNSNSYSHQAIEVLGLPRPTPPVWAPAHGTVLRFGGRQ